MAEVDYEDEQVYTSTHRSLIRPDLILGCERGPIVILLALSFILVVLLQKLLTVGLAASLIMIGIPILRYLAHRDNNWYRVMTRHHTYPSQFSAWPSLGRKPMAYIDQQRRKHSTL